MARLLPWYHLGHGNITVNDTEFATIAKSSFCPLAAPRAVLVVDGGALSELEVFLGDHWVPRGGHLLAASEASTKCTGRVGSHRWSGG